MQGYGSAPGRVNKTAPGTKRTDDKPQGLIGKHVGPAKVVEVKPHFRRMAKRGR